jgi:hypothetical protein
VRQASGMSPLPTPARASIGLAAITVSAARELPRKLVDLPVIAAGTAIQVSLRAQQRYAELIAKGDEVLSQLHGIPEEPPSWATFDEAPDTDAPGVGAGETAVGAAWQEVDLADALEEEAVAELLEAEALAALEDTEAERLAEALDLSALAAEERTGEPNSTGQAAPVTDQSAADGTGRSSTIKKSRHKTPGIPPEGQNPTPDEPGEPEVGEPSPGEPDPATEPAAATEPVDAPTASDAAETSADPDPPGA